MINFRFFGARWTTALLMLGLLAGEALGAGVLHAPFRYFQHQGGTLTTDNAFEGFCFTAAGYNTMLGIVQAGNGTWRAPNGGTEAYGNAISGRYNPVMSPAQLNDGNLDNQTSNWFLPDEDFISTYLKAPDGLAYRTVDYSLDNLASIDQARAIGAMALVDRVDVPDAELLAAEWWLNFHVVSLFTMDIDAMTAQFTDSNLDRTGKEYLNQPGSLLRGDFTYGILSGGGQTLSWDASGIIQNADGPNMDGELLASMRVIYMYQVPEPSSLLLFGLGRVLFLVGRKGTSRRLGSARRTVCPTTPPRHSIRLG